jgi:hypothetical protein
MDFRYGRREGIIDSRLGHICVGYVLLPDCGKNGRRLPSRGID